MSHVCVCIGQCKGTGFVKFDSKDSVEKVLKNEKDADDMLKSVMGNSRKKHRNESSESRMCVYTPVFVYMYTYAYICSLI